MRHAWNMRKYAVHRPVYCRVLSASVRGPLLPQPVEYLACCKLSGLRCPVRMPGSAVLHACTSPVAYATYLVTCRQLSYRPSHG